MSTVKAGGKAPDFSLPATGERTLGLSDFEGRNLLIYFYPKDSTPGCTTEGQDFRDHFQTFQALNTDILGVSRDGVRSHENFRSKHGFPFDLLSDKDETLCRLFDVIREKSLFGKKSLGVERSTFLIDAQGVVRREWRKVKVKGHVEEVLGAVKAL